MIALLPEHRNKGIGRYLIKEVMNEAYKAGKSVQLQVAWYNYAAKSLYERLGFFVIEDKGVGCEMQWN
jgi:ribosomal protein S18 acetylase RimI-like enzyme